MLGNTVSKNKARMNEQMIENHAAWKDVAHGASQYFTLVLFFSGEL